MRGIILPITWILLTLTSLVTALDYYSIVAIPEIIQFSLRWLTIAGFVIYAVLKRNLTTSILVSMVVGIGIGHDFPEIAMNLSFLRKIFLQMIKTIIAPLLFATLVAGIAGHSDLKQVGRMGWKSILYFEIITTLALAVGLAAAYVFRPGGGVNMPADMAQVEELSQYAGKARDLKQIILHAFPENIAKSIAEGEVLQVVVFSILFGIALSQIGPKYKKPMLDFFEGLSETMFKYTNIVMYAAPIGVGGAMAYTVGKMGPEILLNLLKLLLSLYGALFAFFLLVLVPVMLIARIPIKRFLKTVLEPVSIAFATTSSDAALPKAMESMESFGVPRKISAFVLPMGYSFNLDGTTLYLALASLFIADAAGVELSFGTVLLMMLTLVITSKGVAGVPRASMIILLGTAASFNLPTWPIVVILGIDSVMDMGRSATNVLGNCLATAVVARWEGELQIPEEKESVL